MQDSVERQTRNMEETTRESLDRLQSVGEEFANVVAEFGPRAQHAAQRTSVAMDEVQQQTASVLAGSGEVTAGIEQAGEIFRH